MTKKKTMKIKKEIYYVVADGEIGSPLDSLKEAQQEAKELFAGDDTEDLWNSPVEDDAEVHICKVIEIAELEVTRKVKYKKV